MNKEEPKKKRRTISVTLTEKEVSIIVTALDNYVKTMNEDNYVYGVPIEKKRIEIIEKITEKLHNKFAKKFFKKNKGELINNE